MTTQLIIDGHEAVLPQNFSVTVKRENSFFTKSGEYTYDATLRLDNPTNSSLYGFLNRLNKTGEVETNRSAVLIADGHVYCRGKEVITRWTEQTVTIQIVSGESELNYFIGQDQKIEELDMGAIEGIVEDGGGVYPEADYCRVPIRSTSGNIYNNPLGGLRASGQFRTVNTRPQPYLCALLNKIMQALGYTVGTNQLVETQFKNLFIVNTVFTTEYAKMLPGWTVKEFLTEVEKLTGVVFVTNNTDPEHPTCDIVMKTAYYQDAKQFTIRNVTDAYEAEVEDDDSREAEFTSSDVTYDMPDSHWKEIMRLPEGFLESAEIVDFDGILEMMQAFNSADCSKVLHDTATDRYYINITRTYTPAGREEESTAKYTIEINQFKDLDREDTTSKLSLKITPAPMTNIGKYNTEIIDLGSSDGYGEYVADSYETEETVEAGEVGDIENTIRSFEKTESATADLYAAFYNGLKHTWYRNRTVNVAYTDAYHASIQHLLYPLSSIDGPFDGLEGSLRLKDLEAAYFQGGYEIDTRHAYTIETYDPNVIDPRQVYVIRNRRFVCRDVEEVITAQGRQKKWKGTFYPITISDESLEHRWVLTHGVWDDHAAWLDDGRWNDTDPALSDTNSQE